MTGGPISIDALRFGSLRIRIAVLYAGLFAAVLALVVIIASNGVSRFGESSAARDMEANGRVFDEIIALRANQMRGSADILARDFGFREAVATRDKLTINSALESLKIRSRTDAAFVLELDGSLLAQGGADVTSPDAIWYALDDGAQHGIIRLGDDLALAAAAPIEAPDLIGWLILAQPLDRSELERLRHLAAIEIDADVALTGDLPNGLTTSTEGEVFEHRTTERFLFQVSKLPVMEVGLEPRLILRHSLSASLAEYSKLNYLLILLALCGISAVIGLSWRVARTVTGPLNKLDEATRLLSQGKEVSLNIETNDEIGRLASSFNNMVNAIEEREREIIHVGLHDGLTGLPNRKLFIEQLNLKAGRLGEGEKMMVIYADLDDFKVVNDTLGHPSGDALLREVAGNLRDKLPDALVARLGGDEFAIKIMLDNAMGSPAAVAERVQECFERSVMIDGQQAECSASLGIAIAPGDGSDGVTLMKNADLALYRAKSEGKSTYHFFEPELDAQARLRRQTELDLRTALRDGHFELHFQPLYSLAEEKMTGFEALIRWNHPERGRISPTEFIPLAEETGLILPIGDWVIREACRHASLWPDDISVAVNISPKQFGTPGLANTILQALSASGLQPSRLELEITESIFISNVERTLSTLHSLRNLGVRIALDDFGTGYSSLSYLRSFPFDKVKIDRSFVEDLSNGGNAHAVIRAITTLADALGMDTLAEGVEVDEQLDVLRREGCNYIQGFLFSAPVSGDQVFTVLGNGYAGKGKKVA
ncbi:diguanylate cyclase /phosphodiesterase (GGDEF & EAL domains) with PAS /PAC sensor(s) [Altererythrobacter epoxidivorans]|uniref:Diguanylate cyclase /phosphodiesterase (GGDEF & EAL domains) with PAS /PAC sensor(S) n=1 Tax=Altererythrobacter epoxidivorans TaxID=361183 RepID=A0A0M3TAV3_9SPHN|nr:EAL domain-containing protein [Altererythrobacter epoxidivorans]ALE17396.1 diguanylate cyclase /phosphodiesterase (GGDEF & EAL domains) with PAS /PAC sensor(s) [Altererythrobacter epoxidivorans]